MNLPSARRAIAHLLIAALPLSAACTTTSATRENTPETPSQSWVGIGADQRYFVPAGYTPTGETDYRQGAWVHSAQVSFFLPKNGMDHDTRHRLTAEALQFREAYGGHQSESSSILEMPYYPSLSYGEFVTLLKGTATGALIAGAVLLAPFGGLGPP